MQVWEVQFLKKWKNWESFISFVYSYHSSELKKRSSQRNFASLFFRDKQISKFTYVIYKFCSFYVKMKHWWYIIEHQDGLCPICIEELKNTSAKELDHEPSIHQLRENILRQLICKISWNHYSCYMC